MESASSAAVMASPSSDDKFWTNLRDRVDTILDQRSRPKRRSPSNSLTGIGSDTGKRFREDSLLLIRGLDSAAASLAHLTSSLNAAQQNLGELAKPSLANLQQREAQATESEEAEPNAKRHCGPNKLPEDKEEERPDAPALVAKSANLNKAKNLAISMATKAASLARELKTIKSELCFMQERCALLEEENRRLRDGVEKGVRAEEDDLVRLQLEALLAEKSRLANENANLTRENQCLHQLVEYHQLATQDDLLSPSYESAAIHGVCLDFSSPFGKEDGNPEDENSCRGGESASTSCFYSCQ